MEGTCRCTPRATTWKNLHDVHTRDIDHLVHELQLETNYGLLNSKTMGIGLCTMTGKSTTDEKLQLWKIHSFLQSEPQAPCHINVPLVHTGHDVEHLRPDDRREKYSARCSNTRKTNQAHATAMVNNERTVLLVHNGHDAEHLGLSTTEGSKT